MFNNIYEFFKFNRFKPSDYNLTRLWFLQNSRQFFISEEKIINSLISRIWPASIYSINIKKIKTSFFFKFIFLMFFFLLVLLSFLYIKTFFIIFFERYYLIYNLRPLRSLGDRYLLNFDIFFDNSFVNSILFFRTDFFEFYSWFSSKFIAFHISLFF